MRAIRWSWNAASCWALVLAFVFSGCGQEGADEVTQQQVDSAGQEYEIVGRVVAVAENKQSVTLDHEDIPGFMPGMEMKFDIEDPTVVADIEPGDSVQGRLTVKDGSYVISELKRR